MNSNDLFSLSEEGFRGFVILPQDLIFSKEKVRYLLIVKKHGNHRSTFSVLIFDFPALIFSLSVLNLQHLID